MKMKTVVKGIFSNSIYFWGSNFVNLLAPLYSQVQQVYLFWAKLLWPEGKTKLEDTAEPSSLILGPWLDPSGQTEPHGLEWDETDPGKSFVYRDAQSWGSVPYVILVCLVWLYFRAWRGAARFSIWLQGDFPLSQDAFPLGPQQGTSNLPVSKSKTQRNRANELFTIVGITTIKVHQQLYLSPK